MAKTDDVQYVRLERTIWHKKRFKALSQDARELYLYIIINPHGNMTGLFTLPMGYAIEDLGWNDPKRFTKGLDELLDKQLIKYDFDNKIIFDIAQFKKFPSQNENQVKGAIKKLRELPFTPLFQDFKNVVEGLCKPLCKPLLKWLEERLGESVDETVDVTVDETVDVTVNVKPSPSPLPSHIYSPIFDSWNTANIVKHRALTNEMKTAIKNALDKFNTGEIQSAIQNYSEILKSPEYFFKYKWPLEDFLKRGLRKFVDSVDPKNNFKKNNIQGGGKDYDLLKEFD